MMKLLIKTNNLFIGDILFASSVASYFARPPMPGIVDFCVEFLQPIELLDNHPSINKSYFNEMAEEYHTVINLNPLESQGIPATIQFQRQARLPEEDQHLGYEVYTNKSSDYTVSKYYDQIRKSGKKIVVYQQNWEEKSFIFTPEEYKQGVDVPGLGYGGKRRNINRIISELSKYKDIELIPVGLPNGKSQRDFDIYSTTSYTFTASLIKNADLFIGSEGGLSNLAAGVGTRCVITTDFIWQLYGPNGCIRKHEFPAMGPATYFPIFGHVHLDPFLSDDGVVHAIWLATKEV